MDIEFICIPEGERRKGIGKRIFKSISWMVDKLGYKRIVLHSMKASEPFWKAMGFIPVSPQNQNYPRRMYYEL